MIIDFGSIYVNRVTFRTNYVGNYSNFVTPCDKKLVSSIKVTNEIQEECIIIITEIIVEFAFSRVEIFVFVLDFVSHEMRPAKFETLEMKLILAHYFQ